MEYGITMTLTLHPQLYAKMVRLAELDHRSLSEVFLRALTLYEVASDTKVKNEQLVIMDEDMRTVAQITGL